MRRSFKHGLGKASAILLAIVSLPTYAAGYKMEFQSASVLADAGEAAVVEDAGTNWYNSAGLVYLPQQYVFSLIDVYAPTTFTGTATAPSTVLPVPPFNFSASGKASSHPNTLLPAIHYTIPLHEKISFGITLAPAWGFTEDYGQDSLVRYNLTRVYTKTIDIAPSLAYRVNDCLSIGVGPDFHYWSVQSRAKVNTAPLTTEDSVSRFSADRWGFGAHAGILYRLNDQTRIGLNYRSKIFMDLTGTSTFILTGIDGFETSTFRLKVPLPPVTTLSAYHDVSPCWALMGTLAYEQWSVLNNYHAKNVITPTEIVPDVIQQQNYRNQIDASIGTHYRLNDTWLLRGSVKFVSTPTINAFRDVNFPDEKKWGINLGTRYQMNKKLAFDFIYGHVFVRTATINGVNALSGASVSGKNRTSIDLLGGQVVWNI